jgi:uncharacterized membrane protein YdjX (TVP38/TMEM64 family)
VRGAAERPLAGSAAAVARRRRHRLIAAAGLALGLGAAVFGASRGEFSIDPRTFRAQIEALGWLAPVGFVAAAALRPFLALPSWVLMSAGGLVFGIAGGMLYSVIGFGIGALFTFGIARGLGRDAIEQRLHGSVARVDAWLSERGAKWIGAWTALPVTPLTPAHGAAGLSGMRLPVFAAAVLAGLVPRTAVFSFFGDSFAHEDGGRIAVASAVLAAAGLVGFWLARRLRAPAPRASNVSPPAAPGADRTHGPGDG